MTAAKPTIRRKRSDGIYRTTSTHRSHRTTFRGGLLRVYLLFMSVSFVLLQLIPASHPRFGHGNDLLLWKLLPLSTKRQAPRLLRYQDLPESTRRAAALASSASINHNQTGLLELHDLLELSRRYNTTSTTQPTSDNSVSTVACLKTIFGPEKKLVIMQHVLRWVAYNRLLGFDEIYVWYYADFIPPGFDVLGTLPYVRLVENTRNPVVKAGDYAVEVEHAGGQKGDIAECLQVTKQQAVDWVYIADFDEFLWFSEKMRLQEFLQRHRDKNYLSFGKWMYNHKVRVAATADGDDVTSLSSRSSNEKLFGLEQYPFTYKSYCYSMRGERICPNWPGRSKVMFRRDSYDQMNIHGGQPDPNNTPGQVHFDTNEAHIKEWRETFSDIAETVHKPESFKVPATESKEYEKTLDGKYYTLHYDADLQDSFDFVADV